MIEQHRRKGAGEQKATDMSFSLYAADFLSGRVKVTFDHHKLHLNYLTDNRETNERALHRGRADYHLPPDPPYPQLFHLLDVEFCAEQMDCILCSIHKRCREANYFSGGTELPQYPFSKPFFPLILTLSSLLNSH